MVQQLIVSTRVATCSDAVDAAACDRASRGTSVSHMICLAQPTDRANSEMRRPPQTSSHDTPLLHGTF